MTVLRPTLAEIAAQTRADADSKLSSVDARLQRGVLEAILFAHVGGLHGAYGRIDQAILDAYPETAEGEALDRIASGYGLSRGAATFAQGWVGTDAVVSGLLPIDVVFRRSDGVEFIRQAQGIQPNGQTSPNVGQAVYDANAIGVHATGWAVAVKAISAGTDGNTADDATLSLISPVPGYPTDWNARGSISGAVDKESDESLRARIQARRRSPPSGGTADDVKAWALGASTPDDPITHAFVVPPVVGSNVVTVYLLNDGGGVPSARPPTPSAQAIANAEAAFDALATLGAARSMAAPTLTAQPFSIRLSPDTPEARVAIENEIDSFISLNHEPGGEIPLSILQGAISNAAAGADAQIVSPVNNPVTATDEYRYRGVITWNP